MAIDWKAISRPGNRWYNKGGSANPLNWGNESESQKQQREDLGNQAGMASEFGDIGQRNYGKTTAEGEQARDLQRRRAMGEDSMSAEQLRQGLQQQYAMQRSAVAGASPQNAAMAARTGMIQSGRAAATMSGQAAMAGIAERQAAADAWQRGISEARGQDVNVALGSRQNAINAYTGQKPEGSWMDKFGGAATAALGYAASDRRLKTEIRDGSEKANDAMSKLAAHMYRYRAPAKHGEGQQLGVMAQDLRKAGLQHTVRSAPDGLQIDAAKLSGTNTAFIAELAKRLRKLEQSK